MKTTIYHLLFVLPLSVFGQPETSVETDSSIILTKYFEGSYYSVREFNELKNEDVTYYREWHIYTSVLKEEGVFKNGNSWGIWKYYHPDGSPQMEIDYNTDDTVYVLEQSDTSFYNTWGRKYQYKKYSWREEDSILNAAIKSRIPAKNTFTSLDLALENKDQVIALKLAGQGLTEIPDFICEFKNLKILELNCKTITKYDSSGLDIEYSYERCNSISKIPDCISYLPNLRVFYMPYYTPYNVIRQARVKLPYCYVIPVN